MIYYKPNDVFFVVYNYNSFLLFTNHINHTIGIVDYNPINLNYHITVEILKKILNKPWKI